MNFGDNANNIRPMDQKLNPTSLINSFEDWVTSKPTQNNRIQIWDLDSNSMNSTAECRDFATWPLQDPRWVGQNGVTINPTPKYVPHYSMFLTKWDPISLPCVPKTHPKVPFSPFWSAPTHPKRLAVTPQFLFKNAPRLFKNCFCVLHFYSIILI